MLFIDIALTMKTYFNLTSKEQQSNRVYKVVITITLRRCSRYYITDTLCMATASLVRHDYVPSCRDAVNLLPICCKFLTCWASRGTQRRQSQTQSRLPAKVLRLLFVHSFPSLSGDLSDPVYDPTAILVQFYMTETIITRQG